jgi:uncharacterized protein involved in outer membrane biogenesis
MGIKVASTLKWALAALLGLLLLSVLIIVAVLSGYDYNTLKPEIENAVANATGKELTLAGDISLRLGLTPTLVLRDASIRSVPWGSQPDMAKIKRFEIKVRLFPLLNHQLDIVHLALVEPHMLLETDSVGRSNFSIEKEVKAPRAGKGAGAGGWKLSRITFKELLVEKGHVTYVSHASGKSYAVDVASLTASSTGPLGGSIRIRAEGSYDKESFEVEGVVGSLSTFADPSAAWPVNLTVRGVGAVLSVDGSVMDPSARRGMKLNVRLQARDPQHLNRISGLPSQLMGPLDISGRLADTGPNSYSISSLRIIEGENSISGSVKLGLAGKRPMVKAEISARKLDLRAHIGLSGESKARSTKRNKVFSNKPLPLEGLDKMDADMKVSAAEVLLPGMALNNLDFGLTLRDRALDVSSFRAGLGKGTVDVRFSLRPQGKTVLWTSNVKLGKVDIGYLGNIVKALKNVEGNLDADIDVNARGTSVAALMGSMTGRAVLQMGKGRIHNRYIDLLGSDLSTGLFRLLNPFEKQSDHTRVNCFVGGFTMKNGLARTTALVLNTQYMVVVGSGTINLGTERLNLSLKPVPKEGIGADLFGKLGISAGELTRPFRLRGTLAHPRLVIDPGQAAITLGKTIGSVVLLGPAGIAAALAGRASDDENSCAAAIAAARKGGRVEKRKGFPGTVKERAGDVLESIGGKLKDLFGK